MVLSNEHVVEKKATHCNYSKTSHNFVKKKKKEEEGRENTITREHLLFCIPL
jgi:hypothetical protein